MLRAQQIQGLLLEDRPSARARKTSQSFEIMRKLNPTHARQLESGLLTTDAANAIVSFVRHCTQERSGPAQRVAQHASPYVAHNGNIYYQKRPQQQLRAPLLSQDIFVFSVQQLIDPQPKRSSLQDTPTDSKRIATPRHAQTCEGNK